MEFEQIETWLRSRGAPSVCYVVSSAPYLDREVMLLDEAFSGIDQEMGGMGHGVLVSCIPGKLGSYHDHEYLNRQYVLLRP